MYRLLSRFLSNCCLIVVELCSSCALNRHKVTKSHNKSSKSHQRSPKVAKSHPKVDRVRKTGFRALRRKQKVQDKNFIQIRSFFVPAWTRPLRSSILLPAEGRPTESGKLDSELTHTPPPPSPHPTKSHQKVTKSHQKSSKSHRKSPNDATK